jgi:hypothetical protein
MSGGKVVHRYGIGQRFGRWLVGRGAGGTSKNILVVEGRTRVWKARTGIGRMW